MENIFDKEVTNQLINRIQQLTPTTVAVWGKMSVSQMLAHCCITYELVYDSKYSKPNGLVRFILKLFVKNIVVNEIFYKKNSQTAPYFIIKEDKNFELEKNKLIEYLIKTQSLGMAYFQNRESHSFGKLTGLEWNNMFYKHLHHHLSQFGV